MIEQFKDSLLAIDKETNKAFLIIHQSHTLYIGTFNNDTNEITMLNDMVLGVDVILRKTKNLSLNIYELWYEYSTNFYDPDYEYDTMIHDFISETITMLSK